MSDDSFASLYEAQKPSSTNNGRARSFRTGQVIDAVVTQVGKDSIFVELDGKRQGFLEASEFRDIKTGEISLEAGQTVRVRVMEVDTESGTVRLGQAAFKGGDASQLIIAMEAGLPIEGKVTGVNKGGLEIDLGRGLRGFCPMSQISNRFVQDANEFIGQAWNFLVTEVKDGGKNIVLSRKSLMEEEAKQDRARVMSSLEKGKVVQGVVTAVRDFGAFVDIGGFEALLPASEMSKERGSAIDRIKAGESVTAQILEIKIDDKGKERVTLSLLAMTGESPSANPQPRLAAAGPQLTIGAMVTGSVSRIESYGIFVQIEGTDGRGGRGLIPAQELGVPRGVDLQKAFPLGTKLSAAVLETGDGKLKLSLKGAKDAEERAEYTAHKTKVNAPATMGTFADLFNKNITGKKKK
jgi:small subunit ribosomal protein S1